jgi:hypothetical protein
MMEYRGFEIVNLIRPRLGSKAGISDGVGDLCSDPLIVWLRLVNILGGKNLD